MRDMLVFGPALQFLYTGLMAAVALPLALLSATTLLDTPWAVAMERAMKVHCLARRRATLLRSKVSIVFELCCQPFCGL